MLKSNSSNSFRVSMNTRAACNDPIAASNQFVRTSYVVEKQSFHDLKIEPNNNFVYTISQDRMIRAYAIKDGKKIKKFRGSLNEDGYLIKMAIDMSGGLLATSCSDKYIYIWDLNTYECIAYIYGHSEVVSDLKFTSDNQHLITVGDGCIFFWNLAYITTHNTSSNTTISIQRHNSTPSPLSSISRKANYKPPAPTVVKHVPTKSVNPEKVQQRSTTRKMTQSRSYMSNISGRQLEGSGLTDIEDERLSISNKFTQSVTTFSQINENFHKKENLTFVYDVKPAPAQPPPFSTSYSFDEARDLKYTSLDEATSPKTYQLQSNRTRACWGPDINMEFAIADESRVNSANPVYSAADFDQETELDHEPIPSSQCQPVESITRIPVAKKSVQVMPDRSLLFSAKSHFEKRSSSRIQSPNTMLNEAIETNQRVSKQKCSIL